MSARQGSSWGGPFGVGAAVLGALAVWWFSVAYEDRHRAVLASCLDLPANTGMRVGAWAVVVCGALALLVPLVLRLVGRARLGVLAVVAVVAGVVLVGTGVFLVSETLGQGTGRSHCSGAGVPASSIDSE